MCFFSFFLPVERFFSSLRQTSGADDDVRALDIVVDEEDDDDDDANKGSSKVIV